MAIGKPPYLAPTVGPNTPPAVSPGSPQQMAAAYSAASPDGDFWQHIKADLIPGGNVEDLSSYSTTVTFTAPVRRLIVVPTVNNGILINLSAQMPTSQNTADFVCQTQQRIDVPIPDTTTVTVMVLTNVALFPTTIDLYGMNGSYRNQPADLGNNPFPFSQN